MTSAETSGWLVAVALCAVALLALSLAREFLRTVAAMWRPVALVFVSAMLLFVNAQGRELGLSLMDENNVLRIFLLFFALVYWATNNWHSARLGLHAAVVRKRIPVATGDELSRYWPPRLLGVCAHLFAAINLSLAAASQPEFINGDWNRLLAMTAPIAVVCATACVWAVDYRFISERTSPGRSRFARIVYRWFTWLVLIPTVMISLTLAGLLGYAWGHVRSGFALGTCSIIASAVVFLSLVSYVQRKKPLGRTASEADRDADRIKDEAVLVAMTCVLFLVAVVMVVGTFCSPMKLGDALGSMVVAYFALGTILATINITELTIAAGAKRMNVSPRRLGGYVGVVVLAFAILNAVFRSTPFHAVRLCDDKECGATLLPKDRPTVREAARLWYEKARKVHAKAHPHDNGPIPMLIVATAGGGIRAAYWTASVLERLDVDFRAMGGVSPYLFAISGVSGGSVGATAFEAALAVRQQRRCEAPDHPMVDPCPRAMDYLKHDFLAAGLANWIFVDPLSNLLPDLGQIDRGTAIEASFEEASGNELAKPFLNLFSMEAASDWRPVLLLNATHEETGQRIITAHVKVERDVFINSLDALHLLGGDVRASTAAHNSARFFYVSPAGALGHDDGSLIDGGYFENYGALSALEISRAAKEALSEKVPAVKRIILLISSDPELDPDRAVVRIRRAPNGDGCVPSIAERERVATDNDGRNGDGDTANYLSVAHVTDLIPWLEGTPSRNGYLNELFAPFIGIQSVREAHGTRAAAELAAEICAEWDVSDEASSEHRKAATVASVLDQAKQVAVWADAGPAPVLSDKSYFAHMAMCNRPKQGETSPVLAPLGWVLSDATRADFNEIFHHCDNDEEWAHLEAALGK